MYVYGFIYKVTNKVNNKVYIGQTTSTVEDRIDQHNQASTYKEGVFYDAIRRYGWGNFTYEQIDQVISQDELNKKEIYYIEKYRSYIGFKDAHGYNSTLGGEGTRGKSDLLTIEDVVSIKKTLVKTHHNMSDIAKMYGVSFSCIKSILSGKSWRYIEVKGFEPDMYRESFKSKKLKIEDVVEIKKMIMSRRYKIKEIAEKFNLSRKYVSAISSGWLYPYIEVKGFKINTDNIGENNGRAKLTEKDVLNIREMYNNRVSNIEIGKKYGIHPIHVKDICRGKSWGHIKEGINLEGKNFKGENNPSSKIKWKEVNKIKELLINTDLSVTKIGEMFNVSKHIVSKINTGKTWTEENESYPIRKNK